MVRSIVAVLTLVVCIACISATEYKGTITKIDTEKQVLTVKVGEDEKTFTYTDTTEFKRNAKGGTKTIDKEGLTKLAGKIGDKGIAATIDSEEKDGKEVTKDGKPVAAKVQFTGKGKKKSD